MSIRYNGIELELPSGPVALSHSIALDMIRGESGTKNMDWAGTLGDLPWGTLKGVCSDAYVRAGELFSLINMDYQVCNGGIDQYFFNRYHEERGPGSEHDVERYDLDAQKQAFLALAQFGRELFPNRTAENDALLLAAEAFQNLYYEEDARVTETVYCDEEEYIFDEELGEEVENPDYFEPYDEDHYEDVIHGDDHYNDIHSDAIEYMEELFEMSAQYQCKALARDIDKYAAVSPEVAKALREHLPEAAFKKPSLSSQLSDAASRAGNAGHSSVDRDLTPEH